MNAPGATGSVPVLHRPRGTVWLSCGANHGARSQQHPRFAAYGRSNCQTICSVTHWPTTRPPRFTGRKTAPSAILALVAQASIATLTQVGMGTVRNSMMLSNEADNAPPAVPLLNVPERQHCNFGSAEPTAEKQGENGPVPEPLRGRDVWCAQQRLGLTESKPISGADSLGAHAFDP